ncbi:Protein ALP1-like [Bagarius yarrelli]|uniref:Putative nuclease HARBI1 n=1 Tax=Bagarius yarrelli TaxID=175774 RepID=A0A556TM69_BAGYA|nr:Protein ALP1-like [Bagarius yarrelli]
MSYAGAVWHAVQDDLYRNSEPTAKIRTSDSINSATSQENRELLSHLDIFDDYFLSQCFYFSRRCLAFISDCIKARIQKDVFRSDSDATPVEAMTLAALYFYAHGFLPRKITDALGLEHASASDAVNTVSKVLEDMSTDFITFPATYDARMGVAQGFKYISGIPNVVGVLGSLHVHVKPSPSEEHLFLNRRGYHSVMVQIISDVDGNLLSVEQCCPGGTGEQAVWESSSIFQEFNRLQHGQSWVLGGKGLSKAKHVLSPLESSRLKTNATRHFNNAHFQVWKSTQHVFGSLKTRFRCLQSLGSVVADNLKPVARIVNACCVLHNIAKKFSEPLPSKLVLEHFHPDPEMSQEKQENFADIDEAIEDMIEMCFEKSGPEEQLGIKNTEDTEKRHNQNDQNSHFSES